MIVVSDHSRYVVEMCESVGPNPPSHYQFDVLHKIVLYFIQVFALDSCT